MFVVNGYRVKFEHFPTEIGATHGYDPKGNIIQTPFFGRTTCWIISPDGSESYGNGYCSFSEPEFIKEKGRKAAMTRALKNYPKEFRSQIWGAYLRAIHVLPAEEVHAQEG